MSEPQNFFWDRDIFLHTQHPIAKDSLDTRIPAGAVFDRTDGIAFGLQLQRHFGQEHLSLMDLGTGRGTVPLSMRSIGIRSVGLEGSDAPLRHRMDAWVKMPQIVRMCDVSFPFRVTDEEGHRVQFDIVSAWDVFEHIPPAGVPDLLRNVHSLLKSTGYCVASISCEPWERSIAEIKAEYAKLGIAPTVEYIGDVHLKRNYHPSGLPFDSFWKPNLERFFNIDQRFSAWAWKYCRQSPSPHTVYLWLKPKTERVYGKVTIL